MKQMKQTKQLLILTGLAVCLAACQTDGEDAGFIGRVTPVGAEFKFIADPTAEFVVEYAGVEIDNNKKVAYIKENNMSNLLQVYRVENDKRTLELKEQVEVSPVIIKNNADIDINKRFTIQLAQLAAGSPVQLLNAPPAPPSTDSSSIAVQFFYGDVNQPEEVKITILAIDQYSRALLISEGVSVPANMKDTITEINLQRGKLSEPVVLDLYRFKNNVYQMAAQFFYEVSDPVGNTILQDYSDITNNNPVEIKISSKRKNSIPYSDYKSAIMQFEHKDNILFASPVTVLNGEKW
jgi:hypothetical protein